ncbi:uncharacterized protein LOC136004059 isoform X1 [Lathamus discolor]|uniref:uncharacterized protein LOC136004059 isoform X1 n=1 Tax=Lathamus discolor TaxID=678569 RepID=UPI0032B7163B
MEHRTLLLLVPLFLPCGSQGSLECEEQAVSANGMLELLPKKPVREWARVRWRTRSDAGSYQVILAAERNKPASIRKSPFSGRAVFQEEPLSLRISPVHAADAGLYEAEFEEPGGGVSPRCFRVSVWGECPGLRRCAPGLRSPLTASIPAEPLQPPHVETLVLPEARGWCNLSLLCSAAGAGPVSCSWSCSGDAAGELEPGPRLHRRVRGDADPMVCRASCSSGRCPCPWLWMSFKVPSNPSHSMNPGSLT